MLTGLDSCPSFASPKRPQAESNFPSTPSRFWAAEAAEGSWFHERHVKEEAACLIDPDDQVCQTKAPSVLQAVQSGSLAARSLPEEF